MGSQGWRPIPRTGNADPIVDLHGMGDLCPKCSAAPRAPRTIRVTATIDLDHVERQLLEAVSMPGFGPVASNALLAIRYLRGERMPPTETTPCPHERLVNCLELDARALRAAEPAETVRDLAALSLRDIQRRRGVGKKTIERYEAVLARYGLTWSTPT